MPHRPSRPTPHPEDLLAQPLFQGLDLAGDLGRFCPGASVRRLRHGQEVYAQGEPLGDVLCLLDGQVVLSRVRPDWSLFTTGLRFPGDLFGRLDGGEPAEAGEAARSKGAGALWRAPAREFGNLLLHRPDLGVRVVQAEARRRRQLERHVEALVCLRAEARLAETLYQLSDRFRTRCEHGFGVHLRITQQELADLAGASRPVVSTLLNRLRDQGVLGYSRDYLCVRDPGVIEGLAGAAGA
jgi:CRP/FNR family transcriptional regulator, cyclic AMP receptor protein